MWITVTVCTYVLSTMAAVRPPQLQPGRASPVLGVDSLLLNSDYTHIPAPEHQLRNLGRFIFVSSLPKAMPGQVPVE